ncbi:MAG: hypothetical protein ACLRT4_02845 [Thomasclavelia sp.]
MNFFVLFTVGIILYAPIKKIISKLNFKTYIKLEQMFKYLFFLNVILLMFYFEEFGLVILTVYYILFLVIYYVFYNLGLFSSDINLYEENKYKEKFYKINKELVVGSILTVGFVLYYIFVTTLFPNNDFEYIIISLTFFSIIFHAYLCGKRVSYYERLKIPVQSYNIDYEELLNKRIVCLNVKNNYQIVLVDMNSIFPTNSCKRKAYVINQYCYYKESVEDSSILAIALPRININKKLDVYYTYTLNDGKTRKRKCTLYLAIKSENFGTFISDYRFKNFKFALLNYDKYFKNTKNNKFNPKYIPLNSVKYNFETEKNINFDSELESRKWLLHDERLGNGKSLYDLNSAMKLGLQPIIISPWEENYDNDILQLIFSKLVSKYGNPISSIPSNNTLPFICVTFAGTFLFIFSDTVKNTCSYFLTFIISFMKKNDATLLNCLIAHKDILLFISCAVVIIILLYLIMKFLPSIILLKKDNSKIYQEYYINQIVKIMQKYRSACFIIEDIDRLNPNVYNDIFRILSLINKHMYNRENFIGIISLDVNSLKKYKVTFQNISNKLICYKIGTEYDQFDSIDKYVYDGIRFLQKYSEKDLQTEYKKFINEKLENDKLNFRDAKLFVNRVIQMVINEEESRN